MNFYRFMATLTQAGVKPTTMSIVARDRANAMDKAWHHFTYVLPFLSFTRRNIKLVKCEPVSVKMETP